MNTKVILIAGSGRSGSTFLSQLLSQNSDCITVGQIHHLPMSLGNNRICSCGKVLTVCDFWGAVAEKMVIKHGIHAIKDLLSGYDDFIQSSNTLSDWSNVEIRNKIKLENKHFLELLSDLYVISSEQAGNAALIDSSKTPNIALALSMMDNISVYILNLVRDPRAVAVSWAKIIKKQDVLTKRCRLWNKRVDMLDQIELIPNLPFTLLKYEDLTTYPKKTIAQLQKWAGLNEDTAFFTEENEAMISWKDTHLFPPANNEVLEDHASLIQIKPADSWKSEANTPIREIAERVNFPKARRFGYRKASKLGS